MRKLLLILAPVGLFFAFQSWDMYIIGKYTGTSGAMLDIKLDHTFKETRGMDWRTGMWKLSHDTLVIQEGLSHHNTPHVNYPYFQYFLSKKEGIQIGGEMFRKDKAAPAKK